MKRRRKRFKDPVTGDELTLGKHISWMIQGIIQRAYTAHRPISRGSRSNVPPEPALVLLGLSALLELSNRRQLARQSVHRSAVLLEPAQ